MLSIIIVFLLLFGCFAWYRKRRLKFLSVAILSLLVLAVVEIILFGYLLFKVYSGDCFLLIGSQKFLDRLIRQRMEITMTKVHQAHNTFFQIDPQLGYRLASGKTFGKYVTNAQGFRADREYATEPPEQALRLAVFGDSFVFCDGERNRNTWPAMLEKSIGNLEVLNFGISGYGFGQSYLRFMEEGVRYKPDIVFINYLFLGNRDQIDLRTIIAKGDFGLSTLYRVNFKIENDQLIHQAVQPSDFFLPAFRKEFIYKPLGLRSFWWFWESSPLSGMNSIVFLKQIILRRAITSPGYNPDQYEERVHQKMLENLLNEVERLDSRIIFFFPRPLTDLPERVRGLLSKYQDRVLYVNSSRSFSESYRYYKVKRDQLLNGTAHYNAFGNQIYAQIIANILIGREWGRDGRKFVFDPGSRSFVLSIR